MQLYCNIIIDVSYSQPVLGAYNYNMVLAFMSERHNHMGDLYNTTTKGAFRHATLLRASPACLLHRQYAPRSSERHPPSKLQRRESSGEVRKQVADEGDNLDDRTDEGRDVGLLPDGEDEGEDERAEPGGGEGQPLLRGDVLEVREGAGEDGESAVTKLGSACLCAMYGESA